ncbi:hypothetical protein [Oxalobacter formigenes]|uniref:hypothetical protein n=1 Tax=Oxalobacter formigenes TaxID=847 RepID=UPI0037049494
MNAIIANGGQAVIMGNGERWLEEQFENFARDYPDRLPFVSVTMKCGHTVFLPEVMSSWFLHGMSHVDSSRCTVRYMVPCRSFIG